jgi:hypothetical protein
MNKRRHRVSGAMIQAWKDIAGTAKVIYPFAKAKRLEHA